MDDPKHKPDPEDDDVTAEVRRERKFSLAEAVGREAAGALKGASPVPATRQLVMEVEELLDARLVDADGSLRRTIVVRLEGDPPLLAAHFGDPDGVLRVFLDRILAHDGALEALVRDADARWGRDYGEKPRFERDGAAPAEDDPYTVEGVRTLLQVLRDGLVD